MNKDQIREERLHRLIQLRAGPGNRKGMTKGGPNKCTITIKQLQYIKHAQENGIDRPEIKKATQLSHFIVTQAMEGRYDHLLRHYPERHTDTKQRQQDTITDTSTC